MSFGQVIVLLLQTIIILTAPLQLQLLQPFQSVAQQQVTLQQQLLALQQLQVLQKLNALRSPIALKPQPLLLLLPNTQTNIKSNDRYINLNENNLKSNNLKGNSGTEDDEANSITIDAESNDVDNVERPLHRAVLLLPSNGGMIDRGFIGDFISNVPFLPLEVNVPDSISWIYDGISSIISGIGQRLPFRPQMNQIESTAQNKGSLKVLLKQLQMRQQGPMMPYLVIPLSEAVQIEI